MTEGKDEQNRLPLVMRTGERSLRFQFGDKLDQGTYQKVLHFSRLVEQERDMLLQEWVPSYHTVTLYFRKTPQNMNKVISHYLTKWQDANRTMCTDNNKPVSISRRVTIPVCYDEEFSLDMERISNHTNLNRQEIINMHAETVYTVYMIGFLPGFPYLGELNKKLATPRLESPRRRVAKGTVGIGGQQTGIYPLESPGGWNIIGKTPLDLFNPDRKEPFLLQTGDQLTFQPISEREFYTMEKQLKQQPMLINDFIN